MAAAAALTLVAIIPSHFTAGTAKADFTFSLSSYTNSSYPGFTDYVVNAVNTGANWTGSQLQAVDATVATSATTPVHFSRSLREKE